MKRFLLVFIAILLFSSPAESKEDDLVLNNDIYAVTLSEDLQSSEKTLKEKLFDIYHLEIERTDKPAFLLSDILTKEHSKDSIWEKTQIWGAYSGNTSFNFIDNESFGANYSFDYINIKDLSF